MWYKIFNTPEVIKFYVHTNLIIQLKGILEYPSSQKQGEVFLMYNQLKEKLMSLYSFSPLSMKKGRSTIAWTDHFSQISIQAGPCIQS